MPTLERERVLTPEQKEMLDRFLALKRSKQHRLFELADLFEKSCDDKEREEVQSAAAEILFPRSSDAVRAEPLRATESGKEKLQKHRDHVGNKIKKLRVQAGLTQPELAERSGLHQSHICRLELGQHAGTYKTIQRIADALDVAPGEIDPSFE